MKKKRSKKSRAIKKNKEYSIKEEDHVIKEENANKLIKWVNSVYKWLLCIGGIGAFLGIAFILYLTFYSFEATFKVFVETESIVFKVNKEYDLHFDSARVIDNYDSTNNSQNFKGRFSLNRNVSIEIERIADGAVSLTMKAEKSIGKIYSSRNDSLLGTAGKYVKIFLTDIKQRMSEGKTISFYIDGEFLSLGKTISTSDTRISIPLLKSGEVNMIRNTILRKSAYVARTEILDMGDGLEFDDSPQSAFGFVTINEKPGMQAAFRVVANKAKVIKTGPTDLSNKKSGYFIFVSIVDIFLNDHEFQVISIIITIIVSFFGIIANHLNPFK